MAWPFSFMFIGVNCRSELLCQNPQNIHNWIPFRWGKEGKMSFKIILQLPFRLFHFTANPSAVNFLPSCPEILACTFSLDPVGTHFWQICPHCSYNSPRLEICLQSALLCWEGCGRATTSNFTACETFIKWYSGTNWATLKVEKNSIRIIRNEGNWPCILNSWGFLNAGPRLLGDL